MLIPQAIVQQSASVGQEVAYAERTSNLSVTATTEGTADTVVTAGAITADGTSAYRVECFFVCGRADLNADGDLLNCYLYQDGSSIGRIGAISTPTSVANFVPAYMARRLIPAAGSRTFSFRASVTNAVGGLIIAGAGGSGDSVPAFISVTKVT